MLKTGGKAPIPNASHNSKRFVLLVESIMFEKYQKRLVYHFV